MTKIKEIKRLEEGNYLLRDLEEIKTERFSEITIVCPKCNKRGNVLIPMRIRKKEDKSLVKVCIREGKICPHSFIAYLDSDFKVRGTEDWDMII
jgi:hypothetical protein